MKTKMMIFILVFWLFPPDLLNAQVIGIQWNTFLGGISHDSGNDIVLDSSGNIYVTGYSYSTWGSPVQAHSGGYDAFVACQDSNGNLLWHTFLGSAGTEWGEGIALDSSGNIYVTGFSDASWGSPINAHSGGWDAFIGLLDSSGNLLWNTFLGSASDDLGYSIVLDSSGNVYVTGYSYATWGSPVNAYSGGPDAFVACIDSSGNLLWNTFLGSSSPDYGYGIALDNLGNIYVTGISDATWGIPINPYQWGRDIFVAGLDSSGNRLWHTFLGSLSNDYGRDIVLDASGNIYVNGYSDATWGSPVNDHSGGMDVFVAGLDRWGNLSWNTFLGSYGYDYSYDITLDNSGNIYITGKSDVTWGSPINAHSGLDDAFLACLNSSGSRLWNTFLGSVSTDYGHGVTLDSSGNILVIGESTATWGSPINPHSGVADAFVAELSTHPIADIKANGSDGPISITESDSLQIRVSLNRFGSDENVDYWLAYKGPSGWVHYNKTTKTWEPGLGVTHQGALFDLSNKKVFQSSGLSTGIYRFYFGVDMNMNGTVTKSCLYYDMVKVTVTSD